MKKLIVLLLATGLISAAATLVVASSNAPAEVSFTPKFGTVTFNHTSHEQVTDCASCHHTGEFVQCSSCHGVNEGIPNTKDTFHSACIDCHKEQNQGPTRCRDCHVN
ncbi:MAG: cytochrome c3 family protein [Pelovirga sp.]